MEGEGRPRVAGEPPVDNAAIKGEEFRVKDARSCANGRRTN